jgi:hypothetical protein
MEHCLHLGTLWPVVPGITLPKESTVDHGSSLVL